ncbi:hypothetical protein [Streptomyces asiaticus]
MSTESECIREMQSSHAAAAVSAAFDDTNLVAYAGLVPVMRLAERRGLARLVAEKVKLSEAKNSAGAAADAKVTSVVAGMVAGADSIEGLGVLRHGAMPALFGGIRAPSTLGTFLRAFTHGHALQLHAVHRKFLGALAAHTPLLSCPEFRSPVILFQADCGVCSCLRQKSRSYSAGGT